MAEFTFDELTPSTFLRRAAQVYPERTAIVDVNARFSFAQLWERCRALTGALAHLGVGPGDRVAALCTNSHVMAELYYAVPLAGAVIVPLNIRLSADELRYIVEHSGARLLVATGELAELAGVVAATAHVELVVATGTLDDAYEDAIVRGEERLVPVTDERSLLALNYTSGTTGRPKGVMYHHRGAYLQSLAMAFHSRMSAESRYLWTLPMFHCNGWSFVWATVVAGATQVCLRAIEAERIWALLRTEGITHFSAAPTVLSMIAAASEAAAGPLPQPVHADTGGAPPTPALLAALAQLNIAVTHLYGLTETYGPIAINEWHPEWDAEPASARARLRARQGVGNVVSVPLRVVDKAGDDVPPDGQTIGEVTVRGNNVMLGYYRDDAATAAAGIRGWLRTGDLAVMHPDGYVELKDRSKDIIISGGENIASVEVEAALAEHRSVLEVAVVARSDERWGEIPIAFVTLRPGRSATAEELREHVRSRLARFKAPRDVVFAELPKTSTGKIRKDILRTVAEGLPRPKTGSSQSRV